MNTKEKKKFYSPQFSEMAAVTVRRIAWALGGNMVQAISIIALVLSMLFDPKKICVKCKDNSKCHCCSFGICGNIPENVKELLQ